MTIHDKARAVLDACRQAGVMVVTAESCTGGLIAGALTVIAGASDVVERGFVTYSYESKSELLGVPAAMIQEHGVVSESVARAMAEGALANSTAQLSLAVTGIAGPGGAEEDKPVGLVHIACALSGGTTAHQRHVFAGGRDDVRLATVESALDMAIAAVAGQSAVA